MKTRLYPMVQFKKDTWEIDEFECASVFVQVGKEKAMVIDAGIGIGDLIGAIRMTITDKPLVIVATHGHGDHTGAMKLLEGIYALTELTPTKDFTDCQRHPALAQMFMEEFLAESEDFIFDTGMDNVMDLIMNEAR